MRSIILVVPGSIDTRTGGYEYDRRITAGLRTRGWAVEIRENGPFREIADGRTVVVDGLAFSASPDLVLQESSRLRFVPIVHMPRADETGLDPARASALEHDERRSLSAARAVVVTGRRTVDTMVRYGVPPERLAVVEPGTDRAPAARGSGDPDAVHLLCVATVNPGKGHAVLLRALARLDRRDWRLSCVGSLERSPGTADRIRELIHELQIDDRVTLSGAADANALAAAYDAADLFVLATLHETYGMVVAEALARGLPVVATDTGAIADLVGSDAGIVVPAGDEQALAQALSSALDPRVRETLTRGAVRARERLRSWDDAVEEFEAVLEKVGA